METFRLRRTAIVDTGWVLGFVVGYALSGVPAFPALMSGMIWAPAKSVFGFLTVICIGGIVCGGVGAGLGHAVAAVLDSRDMSRRRRRAAAEG